MEAPPSNLTEAVQSSTTCLKKLYKEKWTASTSLSDRNPPCNSIQLEHTAGRSDTAIQMPVPTQKGGIWTAVFSTQLSDLTTIGYMIF